MRAKNLIQRQANLTALPVDILLTLARFLDLYTIFETKHVSRRLYRHIHKLLFKLILWSTFPQFNVTKNDLENLQKNNRTISLRWLSQHSVTVLENNLQNVSRDIYPYYKKNEVLSFFNGARTWGKKSVWVNQVASYTLEDLQPLIIKDKASTLLRKASCLGNLYPYIQDDRLDLDSILKVLNMDQSDSGRVFIIGDLTFIGLLPHLIQFKATRCFELVIRVYLSVHSLLPGLDQANGFSMSAILRLIDISLNKEYFIRFFELMVLLYPLDKAQCPLYSMIKLLCDNNMSDVVHTSINAVAKERKMEILEQWRKLPDYTDLLQQLYVEEKCKAILLDACQNSAGFFSTTTHLSIEDVTSQLKHINAAFSTTFELLQIDEDHPESERLNLTI